VSHNARFWQHVCEHFFHFYALVSVALQPPFGQVRKGAEHDHAPLRQKSGTLAEIFFQKPWHFTQESILRSDDNATLAFNRGKGGGEILIGQNQANPGRTVKNVFFIT
jgi:hypothetical protein